MSNNSCNHTCKTTTTTNDNNDDSNDQQQQQPSLHFDSFVVDSKNTMISKQSFNDCNDNCTKINEVVKGDTEVHNQVARFTEITMNQKKNGPQKEATTSAVVSHDRYMIPNKINTVVVIEDMKRSGNCMNNKDGDNNNSNKNNNFFVMVGRNFRKQEKNHNNQKKKQQEQKSHHRHPRTNPLPQKVLILLSKLVNRKCVVYPCLLVFISFSFQSCV